MTLTKAHIIEAVAGQNGYPKNRSFEIIETLLELIKRTLESGQNALVIGFGVIVHRKTRRTLSVNFSLFSV